MYLQPVVVPLVCARAPMQPGVVSAWRHLQHAAQAPHGVVGLLLVNERESHAFSFAKKAAAFFRISRSSRNTRTSRRSVRSSVFFFRGVTKAALSICGLGS